MIAVTSVRRATNVLLQTGEQIGDRAVDDRRTHRVSRWEGRTGGVRLPLEHVRARAIEEELEHVVEDDVPRRGGEQQARGVLVLRVPEESRRHADDRQHDDAGAEGRDLGHDGGEQGVWWSRAIGARRRRSAACSPSSPISPNSANPNVATTATTMPASEEDADGDIELLGMEPDPPQSAEDEVPEEHEVPASARCGVLAQGRGRKAGNRWHRDAASGMWEGSQDAVKRARAAIRHASRVWA